MSTIEASRVEYKPLFPLAHALLLSTYSAAIRSEGEEVGPACDRLEGLIEGWKILLDEGVLPPIFARRFWRDVQDVARRVSSSVEISTRTEKQKILTFALENLRSDFGGN